MRTLLLITNDMPWWIEGPQQLVLVKETRSFEVSYSGSTVYMLTRSFSTVAGGEPEVVVALRGLRGIWDKDHINYNAITLRSLPGYSVVEPPNPYITAATPRSYRRCVVGCDELTGPWRRTMAEAAYDLTSLVAKWFSENTPVLEMMLDAQAGVESAVLTDGGKETNWRHEGNFYEVRDLAITRGWMERGTGRWLMVGYTTADLAEAKQRAEGWKLDPAVIRAVNEQFWDL